MYARGAAAVGSARSKFATVVPLVLPEWDEALDGKVPTTEALAAGGGHYEVMLSVFHDGLLGILLGHFWQVQSDFAQLHMRRDRVHINILLASIDHRAARRRRERYCGAEEQGQAMHRHRLHSARGESVRLH